MTRPKLGRQPVSSFGPELMQLLIEGSRRRVEIPCESMAQMKHLQSRIHTLRGAMNKERHPQYELATRAKTSATWDFESYPPGTRFPRDAKNCILVIAPRDSEFGDLLAKAGVTIADTTQDLLTEAPLPDTPSDPSLAPAPESSDSSFNPYEKFIK